MPVLSGSQEWKGCPRQGREPPHGQTEMESAQEGVRSASAHGPRARTRVRPALLRNRLLTGTDLSGALGGVSLHSRPAPWCRERLDQTDEDTACLRFQSPAPLRSDTWLSYRQHSQSKRQPLFLKRFTVIQIKITRTKVQIHLELREKLKAE